MIILNSKRDLRCQRIGTYFSLKCALSNGKLKTCLSKGAKQKINASTWDQLILSSKKLIPKSKMQMTMLKEQKLTFKSSKISVKHLFEVKYMLRWLEETFDGPTLMLSKNMSTDFDRTDLSGVVEKAWWCCKLSYSWSQGRE